MRTQTEQLCNPTQRETWLDCARVVAALLIVFYHLPSSHLVLTGAASNVRNFNSFLFASPTESIYFFFVTAGYFVKRSFKVQIWLKRLLLLFVGYITWNTLCAVGLNDEISLSRIYGLGSPSKLCADYPLWFVRDLFVMTLFIPLMRYFTCLWILAFLCLIYVFHINSYVIAGSFALPTCDAWIIFLLGYMLNRFDLTQIKHFISKFLFILLFLWGAVVSIKYCYPQLFARNELLIICIFILALSVILVGYILGNYLPRRIGIWIASFAESTFLCFALHGPFLILFSLLIYKYLPSLLSNSFIIILLPFAILALSKFTDNFINKRIPFLQPLLCNRFARKKLQRD